MELFLCVLISLLFIVIYFSKLVRLVCLGLQTPGPSALPLLGNILAVNHIAKQMEDWVCRFNSSRISRFWVAIVPYFILLEPKDIRLVLNNGKVTQKSSLFCNVLKCVIGEGLVTNNGYKWEKNRRIIQGVFTMSVLKSYVNIFSEIAEDVAGLLEDKIDVNVAVYVNQFVLRTSWHTVLGVSGRCCEEEFVKRKKMLTGHNKMNTWTVIKALCNQIGLDGDGKLSKTELHHRIKELMEQNQKQDSSKDFKSLLDWFSEISSYNGDFTEDDVINETSTFIHASYDTVRSAITFALYSIARYKEVQEKLVEELDSVLDDWENITVDHLNRMQYLEQCIKESMRLYPSAPLLLRQTTQELEIGNFIFPISTTFLISPYVIHRLSQNFPEPLKFNPDRFSRENISKITPYSYIPFSMGPRNCIGYKYAILEMKTFLASILRRYRISIAPGHEELNLTFNVTLVNRGGMWLRFKDRKNSSVKS